MMEVWVPEEYFVSAINLFNNQKGELQDMGMDNSGGSMTVIKYLMPT